MKIPKISIFVYSGNIYKFLLFIFCLIIVSSYTSDVYAGPPATSEDEIEIESDEVNQHDKKAHKKKHKKEEEGFDAEDKSDEDLSDEDLTRELEEGIKHRKVEQQTEKEAPVMTSFYDSDVDRALGRKKHDVPVYFEINLGPDMALLDLVGHYGLNINTSFLFRVAKYYAVGISGGFAFTGSPSGQFKSGLEISLSNRLLFPIVKKKDVPVMEGFIDFKTGFITREVQYEDQDYNISGVNLSVSLGVTKQINKNLWWTAQTTYAAPYWLQQCTDYTGAYHCNSTDIQGHDIKLNFGVILVF